MAKTFFALLPLADLTPKKASGAQDLAADGRETEKPPAPPFAGQRSGVLPGLHYNIQIHLPATKDVEVYNAIFKSLKEHLVS